MENQKTAEEILESNAATQAYDPEREQQILANLDKSIRDVIVDPETGKVDPEALASLNEVRVAMGQTLVILDEEGSPKLAA